VEIALAILTAAKAEVWFLAAAFEDVDVDRQTFEISDRLIKSSNSQVEVSMAIYSDSKLFTIFFNRRGSEGVKNRS
jgi:hypothetical protein